MAPSNHILSSSDPPLYYPSHEGPMSEYITIEPISYKETGESRAFRANGHDTSRSTINYLPPPFPPPGLVDKSSTLLPFSQRHRKLIRITKYIITAALLTAGLAVPLLIFHYRHTEEERQKDLSYHIYLWLLITWGCACTSNLLINVFPYLFRFVAQWVNPGHVKYWRIFRFLRLAVTLLGATIGSYVSFDLLVLNNKSLQKKRAGDKPKHGSFEWEDILKNLAINANKKLSKPADNEWQKILSEVLGIAIIWAVLYTLQKISTLYISIHYHYRADGNRIEKSKRMRGALATLYEASTSLYPTFREPFISEDNVIRDLDRSSNGTAAFLSKLGSTGTKIKDGLESFFSNSDKPNRLNLASSYAVVDRALEHQTSSAALAKRLWLSLVPEGHTTLTTEDVVAVLGTHRTVEAEHAFKIIDENENSDITLNEMLLTVLETGKTYRAVYQGMTDINRAINTLDWLCCSLIMMTVTIYAVVRYVPTLTSMKDAAGFAALGLTWGLGRSVYEFINGCIFILFKHAYDIGDRIEIYNPQATIRTSVTVKKISILFSVFTRIDNGKDLQMSNDRLNMKRIENVTRSGSNREDVSIFVDFNTAFTEIQYLKSELQAFLSNKDNARDYQPGCEIRVTSIHEMNKLELKCSFTHKSNWANEELRAARSSKFMCALVAAIRRIQIVRLGGLYPNPIRKVEVEERKEKAAYNDLTVIPKRSDNAIQEITSSSASGAEINSWIRQRSTGLRRKPERIPGGPVFGR